MFIGQSVAVLQTASVPITANILKKLDNFHHI